MYFDLTKIKPIAFYPYSSIVQDRIFDIEDYYNIPEIKEFQQYLIDWFKDNGIKAARDSKIAFEVEIKGVRLFYGFKDWRFSIGMSVRSDSWIKPVTADTK
jgi:hypothetical protein